MDQFNIPKKDDLALDDLTSTNALDARAEQLGKGNPIGGALDIGKNMLEVGEMFGIDKGTVGKMLLKGVLTGKFDLPGMKGETNSKRKRLEVVVDQVIKLAWTFLGIFLVLQTFFFVTRVVLIL